MTETGTYAVRPAHATAIAKRRGVSTRHAMNVLSRLVQGGKARRLAKGIYGPAPRVRPRTLRTTLAMRRVARVMTKDLPALEPVISSTAQVARLMHNAPVREIVLVEVARPFAAAVARALGAKGLQALVVANRNDMERLASLSGRALVAVIPIGELRASIPFAGVRMARPERLLVDLAVERERVGLPIYAEDVRAVGESLLAEYDFSISRALDYARRRRAYDRTTELLHSLIDRNERLRPYAAAFR